MLPKAHLTSHSRMSGSRWVITPSWLSWSWRSFCTVCLCILATSSYYLLLLLGAYHSYPLLCPYFFSLSCIGEGNGNPPQCSCLENPRDRGACWAAIDGVTQSGTRLKRLSSSAHICMKCSLGIYNFLEETSSLSHSSVFLYFFAVITEKAFLSLLAILWNSAFKWV